MNNHGFELLRDEKIDELNSQVRLFRHLQTGTELISIENDDENKAFGITFRTPPADSTGLPHIMEHCVLGGSRKYRVKEPFVELIKGSVNTFVNALTFADMTSYPVASTNTQDFYNLVDVYLDAVLHPLITPHHLEQEGWHFELENKDDPLIYKGIVFNEMKGAYSAPETLLYVHTKAMLFPDSPYQYSSGGDPKVMPELDYEQFRAFHETYYHPSNSRIFFYGDDHPEKRLELIDSYLSEFERLLIDSAIPLQSPFATPQRASFPYAVEPDSPNSEKCYITLNWVLPEIQDPILKMGLAIMSYAMQSTQASPLRKILLDSSLGEDVIGGGLSSQLRQPTFSLGMKGVSPTNVDEVEKLILDSIEELAATGFEPEMVEAAVNTIEFNLRENNTGRFPRGLSLMFRALSAWLHDNDPLQPLRFEEELTAVKAKLTDIPTYLQEMIHTYLLHNSHRSTIILQPDSGLQKRVEEEEKAQLAAVKARQSDKLLDQIIANTQKLKALQEKPDDPQALAAIPRLTLADLDQDAHKIPTEVIDFQGAKLITHDLFTNGICYLEIGFDLHVLPQELLQYARLFSTALVQMGTDEESYVRLSQRIGRKTGGIGPSTYISGKYEEDGAATWLFLSGKATMEQVADMLSIMCDILLRVKLEDKERFKQIVLKSRAAIESGLIPGGHSVVNRRLRSYYSEAGWVNEQLFGIEYLLFLRRIIEQIETDYDGIVAKMEAVRNHLISRRNMIINVTLDDDKLHDIKGILAEFVDSMPRKKVQTAVWNWQRPQRHEGFTLPAQVNYVAKGARLTDFGYRHHGSAAVITNYLRTTWLWEKIRVQGGAYGGTIQYGTYSGVLSFLSYRDPNLLSTLENYDRTGDFLRRELHADELTKSIIGTISDLDTYLLPDAKGSTALRRYLTNISDGLRQQKRDEVFATTHEEFVRFGEFVDRVRDEGFVVVLGGVEALQGANLARGADWLDITKLL